jgi:hypothetical protein
VGVGGMSITLTMSKSYLEEVFRRSFELEIAYKPVYESIVDRLKTTRAYTLWVFPTNQFAKVRSDWVYYWWGGAYSKGYVSQQEYEFIVAYKSLWTNGLEKILRSVPAEDMVQVSIDTVKHVTTLEENCRKVSYHGSGLC